jgi:L-amino acid N-acyltransferase YncA
MTGNEGYERNTALRPATAADVDLLFDWVNRPDSLAAKLQTDAPVARDTHDDWFARRLADTDTAIWIAEQEGRPVGQVRLQLRTNALEVDIYVIPAARRAGTARKMLCAAAKASRQRWPDIPLRALVRHENAASLRLFQSAGFRKSGAVADFVALELPLPASGLQPHKPNEPKSA